MLCVLRASVYFFSHSFTLAVRLWSKSWYFWVDCLFLCKYVHGIINDFSCILLFCISIFILRTVYVLVCMWLFACTYVWWLRLWVCLCVNVFICVSLLCLCTCREVTWWRTRISETSGSLIQDIERKSSTRHATCPRCLISLSSALRRPATDRISNNKKTPIRTSTSLTIANKLKIDKWHPDMCYSVEGVFMLSIEWVKPEATKLSKQTKWQSGFI